MPPGHPQIADIAAQAGLSVSTVDRVLHGRAHVSDRARRRVDRALADLQHQGTQLGLDGLTLTLDVVIHAPTRFSSGVRAALAAELPRVRVANLRARYEVREGGDHEALVAVLDGIGRRGRVSDGVILTAPDDPLIAAAVDRLRERGIPVVTLGSDVRHCRRIAYVGPDNTAAGATAAFLVSQWISRSDGAVLVAVSGSMMAGDQERLAGFTATMSRLDKGRELITLSETTLFDATLSDADGLDPGVGHLVRELVLTRQDLVAVYSIGGGNRAIATELRAAGITPLVHLGHDLDADNDELLRTGVLTAVMHHELQHDMRAVVEQFHRILPGAPTTVPATPQVVTAYNRG